jgi:hypothetical protein
VGVSCTDHKVLLRVQVAVCLLQLCQHLKKSADTFSEQRQRVQNQQAVVSAAFLLSHLHSVHNSKKRGHVILKSTSIALDISCFEINENLNCGF